LTSQRCIHPCSLSPWEWARDMCDGSGREEGAGRCEQSAISAAISLDRAGADVTANTCVMRRSSSESRWRSIQTEVTAGPVRLVDNLLNLFCRKKRWQLIAAVLCGVVAVYTQASSWMSQTLFGANWERSWLWWFVAVPIDVCLAIFFTRFVGSFLGRIWLREISESTITRQAIITLLSGLVQDTRVPELLTALLRHDVVMGSLCQLTASVLQSSEVRKAAAATTASVLGSEATQEATVQATTSIMSNPRLASDMEALLDAKELGRPLAGQVSRLLDDSRVRHSVTELMREVLQDSNVKEVLHVRAVSLMGDRKVYEAGRQGVAAAMFPGRC